MASRPPDEKSPTVAVHSSSRVRNKPGTYEEEEVSGDEEPKEGGDDDYEEDLGAPPRLIPSHSSSSSSRSLSRSSSGLKSRKRGRGSAPPPPPRHSRGGSSSSGKDMEDDDNLPPSVTPLSTAAIRIVANFLSESKDVVATVSNLLNGYLSSLRTFSPAMEKVSGILDSIFAILGNRQVELAREICTQLGLNYDLPALKRFLALVDTDGEKVNVRVSRNTYIIMSLINDEQTKICVANVAANAGLSVAKAASYDAMKLKMPPGSSPLQIQKAVDKEQRGKARKSTASPAGLSSSSSSSSSTGGEDRSSIGVGGGEGSAIGSPIISRRRISHEGAVKLAQHIYGDCVLWSEQDLGNIEKADTVVCASFPVCALGNVVPRNFHRNGFSSGFCFAIGGETALKICLNGQGRFPVAVDLCSAAFPADAFDKGVPASARSMMQSMASLIVGLNPQDIIGLGVHTNKALDAAAIALHGDGVQIAGVQRTLLYGGSRKRSRNSTSLSSSSSSSSSSMPVLTGALFITHFQHPTALSTYLCGNIASLATAIYYDQVLNYPHVSFRGLVLLQGLRGDNGNGGALGAAMGLRNTEILSRLPTSVLPMAVEAFALSKKLTNDDEASVFLNRNGKCALDLPHSRLAAFLQEAGLKSGRLLNQLINLKLAMFDGNTLRRSTMGAEDRLASERQTANARASFVINGVGGGFDGAAIAFTENEIDDMLAASVTDDVVAFTHNSLFQMLRRLDGSIQGGIRGGLESGRRLNQLLNLKRSLFDGNTLRRATMSVEDRLASEQQTANARASFLINGVGGGFDGAAIAFTENEIDDMLAASVTDDVVAFTHNSLFQMLRRLDGSIRGGLESARRLSMLLDFLPENAALRRDFFDSQRVIMAANPLDTGYRGQYVFMCQEEMDLLVAISSQFDDDPLTLHRLRMQLNRVEGSIRGGLESVKSKEQLYKATGGRVDLGKGLN